MVLKQFYFKRTTVCAHWIDSLLCKYFEISEKNREFSMPYSTDVHIQNPNDVINRRHTRTYKRPATRSIWTQSSFTVRELKHEVLHHSFYCHRILLRVARNSSYWSVFLWSLLLHRRSLLSRRSAGLFSKQPAGGRWGRWKWWARKRSCVETHRANRTPRSTMRLHVPAMLPSVMWSSRFCSTRATVEDRRKHSNPRPAIPRNIQKQHFAAFSFHEQFEQHIL